MPKTSKEGKSKLQFYLEGRAPWVPEKPTEYMMKLTRKQASTIFKARTRMTKIKGNYKNQYPDQTCRACKSSSETHLHALAECPELNPAPEPSTNDTPKTPQFFSENTEVLKDEAIRINEICEKLDEL